MKKALTITLVIVIVLSTTLVTFATTSFSADAIPAVDTASETTTNVVEDNKTVTDVIHVCEIECANESYHRYSCEECDNYSRVYHSNETMNTLVRNEWFHVRECADCGYNYSEAHIFATAYTTVGHYDVCIDCGYTTDLVEHIMVDDIWSSYHDIWCEYCGYTAEHHVGTNYTCIDASNCQATCSCGIVAEIPHDWDGFVCDGCRYAMSGDTYAVVGRISKNEDGDYRVRFIGNDGTHRINMQDINGFKEGDFVKISHYGNDIFSVTVMVDANIINDEENFHNYISDEIAESSENLVFDDVLIKELQYDPENPNRITGISFESDTRFMGFNDYIVFDLIEGEIGELEEDFAYVTFTANETTYFICFW